MINNTGKKDNPGSLYCILGVGDGNGNLFVEGSYEAISRAQAMILHMEKLDAKMEQALDILEELRERASSKGAVEIDQLREWYRTNPRP